MTATPMASVRDVTTQASLKVTGKVAKPKKRERTFKGYIHKLLRAKKPKKAITAKGMLIMNAFVTDLFERLAAEAARLSEHAGVKTLSSKVMIAAVKMQLPEEMAKQALTQAAKNVGLYARRIKQKKGSSGKKVSKEADQ
eukprot:TRINITY_DN15653_c0_g3_i1.p2 TRINITY_DN15653_c0_g3~~TRINITY_DN15653_c0_g3_i1.p2  ORF type:complete len:140 (+),score=47.92 TRINITY_DN15653_c0_g3_i1:67-486(+)